MPLLPGKQNVGRNIKELEESGHPRKQAEAIALKEAGESKSKNAAEAAAAPTAPGGANTSVPTLGSNKKKPLKVEFAKDEFTTLEGVPIFDEHDGQEEGLDLDFTPEVLQQIIDACNQRIQDTGDLVPVTDRHTSDDPTDPEPEVLGFASNFRLGDIGKTNPRKAIYADLHIHPDKVEKARSLPRRSIELWPDMVADPVVLKEADKNPIDSISLLGAQRPARDLGLLFQKKQNTPARYRYELQPDKENMDTQEIVKQCVEALANTPEFSFLRDLMQEKQAEADKAQYEEEEKKDEEKAEFDEEKEHTDDEVAGGSEDEKKDEDEHEDDLEPAKLRMQRDQERRRYAKLEANYKSLFAKVETLEKEKRLADRKADLISLEGEGYHFDIAEELEYVADMQPKQYSKHLAKIRKNYAKAPIGVDIKPAPVKAEGGLGEVDLNPAQVAEKAIKMAAEKYKK